jgi:hypothetical protein
VTQALPITRDGAGVDLEAGFAHLRFHATGTDIAGLGEEHGHRVLRVCGKGG